MYYIVVFRFCRPALTILFLLFSLIIVITYSSMFFFTQVNPYAGENTFDNFGKSLQNFWLGAIGSNYDFLTPWDKNIFIRLSIFALSLFTTVVVVNLLSMYLQILFFFCLTA